LRSEAPAGTEGDVDSDPRSSGLDLALDVDLDLWSSTENLVASIA